MAIAISFNFIVFPHHEIVYNIGYGVFGSSLVTFFILIVDYNSLKRDSYEEFFTEYINFLKLLSSISFLDINEEREVYVKYASNKNLFWNLFDSTKEKDEWLKEAKGELYKITGDEYFSKMDVTIIEKYIETKLVDLSNLIKKTSETYISLSKYNTNKLTKAYTSIYTFCKAKYNSKDLYDSLYKPALDVIKTVSDESYHLDGFIKGEINNVYVIAMKINKLNRIYFKYEVNNGTTKVWSQTFNMLSNELSKAICKFNGTKYEEHKYQCVYMFSRNPSIEIKVNNTKK